MMKDSLRPPPIVAPISYIVDPDSSPEGCAPTRWGALYQMFIRSFGSAGKKAFKNLDDSKFHSIRELVDVARVQNGLVWTELDAASYIARLSFGENTLHHPAIPSLFQGLEDKTAFRRHLREFWASSELQKEGTILTSAIDLCQEIERFLIGLGPACNVRWLHEMIRFYFLLWTVEQVFGRRLVTLWLPGLVHQSVQSTNPPLEFHFYPGENERDGEALDRAQRELREAYRLRTSSAVRIGRPLDVRRFDRQANWSYEVQVHPKEGIRQVARRYFNDPSRSKEIKRGIDDVASVLAVDNMPKHGVGCKYPNLLEFQSLLRGARFWDYSSGQFFPRL